MYEFLMPPGGTTGCNEDNTAEKAPGPYGCAFKFYLKIILKIVLVKNPPNRLESVQISRLHL
jgi:hypothetical protein